MCSTPNQTLLAAMLMLLMLAPAQAQTYMSLQNPSCNRAFKHDRCDYVTGQVGETMRQGIVCRPTSSIGAPLVLVFHGHGGCAFSMALATRIHEEWPEAMVVYLDGLTGVSTPNDPRGFETGWQLYPDTHDNRDVRLVDAVIDAFGASYSIDTSRVYAIGHSNGSRFVGVLWAMRSDRLRSLIFNAAQVGDLFAHHGNTMPPRPVAMTMGRNDCVVPFNATLDCQTPVASADNFQEDSINLVRRKLGIDEGPTPLSAISEAGAAGKELGIYVHDGGHEWPSDETLLAVQFMRRN